jgi:hypothetical protein
MKRPNRQKAHGDRPTLPELDQTKRSVLNSLASLQFRRSYHSSAHSRCTKAVAIAV